MYLPPASFAQFVSACFMLAGGSCRRFCCYVCFGFALRNAYVFTTQLRRASYAHNYCERSETQGDEWPVSNQTQPVRRWGYRSLHPGLWAARGSLSGDEQSRHSLIASCFVLFHWYPWEACAFLRGNLGRGGMERRPRGVAWMYCMREE